MQLASIMDPAQDVERLIPLIRDARTTNDVSVAMLTVVLLEHVSTFEEEIRLIWNTRLSPANVFYVIVSCLVYSFLRSLKRYVSCVDPLFHSGGHRVRDLILEPTWNAHLVAAWTCHVCHPMNFSSFLTPFRSHATLLKLGQVVGPAFDSPFTTLDVLSCQTIVFVELASSTLILVLTDIILALRVWLLYHRSRKVLYFLVGLVTGNRGNSNGLIRVLCYPATRQCVLFRFIQGPATKCCTAYVFVGPALQGCYSLGPSSFSSRNTLNLTRSHRGPAAVHLLRASDIHSQHHHVRHDLAQMPLSRLAPDICDVSVSEGRSLLVSRGDPGQHRRDRAMARLPGQSVRNSGHVGDATTLPCPAHSRLMIARSPPTSIMALIGARVLLNIKEVVTVAPHDTEIPAFERSDRHSSGTARA
ncbi:unnamed protein product [Mycena citricolor]|uniref:DUF6533 domain-containing protein n=1 Tax=Mycena citricolor TaxID=2018698 RepID=A0AAD2JUR6_9AGAR|nr:unnamed protein product [Mycena citricolor]